MLHTFLLVSNALASASTGGAATASTARNENKGKKEVFIVSEDLVIVVVDVSERLCKVLESDSGKVLLVLVHRRMSHLCVQKHEVDRYHTDQFRRSEN